MSWCVERVLVLELGVGVGVGVVEEEMGIGKKRIWIVIRWNG